MIAREIKHESSRSNYIYHAQRCDRAGRGEISRGRKIWRNLSRALSRASSRISRCHEAWLPTVRRLLTCDALHRLLRRSLILGNNNRGGLDIDMGYMRNGGPNRNGHRKSSTIIVGQLTGGADANDGAVRTIPTHVGLAVYRVTHGMPGTSTEYPRENLRRDVKGSSAADNEHECSQETHRLIPVIIRPRLLMQTGSHSCCIFPLPSFFQIGENRKNNWARVLSTPPYMDDSVGCRVEKWKLPHMISVPIWIAICMKQREK